MDTSTLAYSRYCILNTRSSAHRTSLVNWIWWSTSTIGFNLDSKKLGKKGIIKIADKFFCDEEINRISVVAPHVKLNIIRDYEVVEKKEVKMPDELRGIVKCANPKCITNNEPMATIFHVIDKDNCIVKCHYCEKEQKREEITIL